MEIKRSEDGGILVIEVTGRLDAATSPVLDEEVRRQLEGGQTRLVFDLSALDYVSSAGLRVFVMAARLLRGTGSLAFAAPVPRVQQVFDIAGVAVFAPVYRTRADAIAALQAGR